MKPSFAHRLLAEGLGTFLLVAFGCGSVIVDGLHGHPFGLVGIALTWGALVTGLVYAFEHHSGAQFNPAVTIALWSVGRVPAREVLPSVIAQVLGATAASALLLWLLGDAAGSGVTATALDPLRAGVVEFGASFLVMAVIAGAALDARTPRGVAPLAIGLTITVCVLVAGPLTGASMNPARSFGPAVIAGAWANLWLYWVAPIAGMLAAAQLLAPKD